MKSRLSQLFSSSGWQLVAAARVALTFSFVLLMCISFAVSQEKARADDESNLYYQALLTSMDKMAESWGQIDDSYNGIRTDYRHMIVEKNDEFTKELSLTLGGHSVEYLGVQELIDRYHKLQKKFMILVIHPIKYDGTDLQISITTHWVSVPKRSIMYELEGWSTVRFRYDCEKHTYVIKDVKLGGI